MASLTIQITHQNENFTVKFHSYYNMGAGGYEIIRNRNQKVMRKGSKLYKNVMEKALAEFDKQYPRI